MPVTSQHHDGHTAQSEHGTRAPHQGRHQAGFARRLALAALLCLGATAGALADPAGTEQLSADGTGPRLLATGRPIYPRLARVRGVEGWVLVGYTVTVTGATSDIEILDASIEGYFEESARRAIAAYRYEPATFLGDPVSQPGLSERIFFLLSSQAWEVGDEFEAGYAQASAALQEGKIDEARSLIDRIASTEQRWLAEVFYLELAELRYARLVNDMGKARRHLDRALLVAKEKGPRGVQFGVLRESVALYRQTGDYRAALQDYEQLDSLSGGLAGDDPIRDLAASLRDTLRGDAPLVREAVLETCEMCRPRITVWEGLLNRSAFSIEALEGEVSDVEVSCGEHAFSFDFASEVTWRIDEEWGDCELRIYGEEGARFRLAEPPETTVSP